MERPNRRCSISVPAPSRTVRCQSDHFQRLFRSLKRNFSDCRFDTSVRVEQQPVRLTRGNLRRIFCSKSNPGLFRPARMWRFPKAGFRGSRPSGWRLNLRFSSIVAISPSFPVFFTKINIFLCKTTILYDCKMLIVVDNVYKCNYSNMVKYLRILCVNYLYI